MCLKERFERGTAALALAFLLAPLVFPSNAGAAGADPDASITAKDITLSLYDPAEGDTVIIMAHVEYHISTPDTDLIVEFILDGLMWSYTGIMAGPNETSMDVTFDWIASKGEHIITIALDPQNDVIETDEGNNNASIDLHARALPVNPPETNWTLWAAVALVLVAGIALAVLAHRSVRRSREMAAGEGRTREEETSGGKDEAQAEETGEAEEKEKDEEKAANTDHNEIEKEPRGTGEDGKKASKDED